MPLIQVKFAFKIAAEAARVDSLMGRIYSKAIQKVTGGLYSHVELVIDDSVPAHALSFSSREPSGTGFTHINLTDTALWDVVDGFAVDKATIMAWCDGRSGRRYNMAGIAGIALGKAISDPADDYCSQCCYEAARYFGRLAPSIPSEFVAPSGMGKDKKRYGLYELLDGTQRP
jgi:hypothetical protein